MRRLVHKGTTVELPCPTPFCLIVILLWARPPHGRIGEVNPTKTSRLDRLAQQLNGRIETILLHHEQLDFRIVAGVHQGVGRSERDGHRLLANHVLSGLGRQNSMLRMQSAGRGDDHDIAVRFAQHAFVVGEPRHTE